MAALDAQVWVAVSLCMVRARSLVLMVLLIPLLVGCESPTEPSGVGFAGSFHGSLDDVLGEDWSSVTLTLRQNGQELTGELISGNGIRHAVSGSPGGLRVHDLPRPTECIGLSLITENTAWAGGTVTAFSGRMEGRCFGTVAGKFVFSRW